MNFLKILTLSIGLFLISNKSFSQCFEIESILVDACDNGTDEGYNEMFRMKIGGTALNTSTLSVNWPAQTWLGLVQNATTASKVAQLNANIASTGGCGLILEPTGGVLPANSTVIVVTSQNLDITLNSFSSLTSTIYMIFQNNPSTTGGHFANYNLPAATRTLTVTFGAGCSDSVTYQRANLVNIFGAVGGSVADLNGSTVNFTPSGTASYVNNGCVAPVQPFTVEAGTTPVAACPGQTINLSGTAQGQTSVSWSAASGSFSAANNLLTSYTVPAAATSGSSITLTLTATNSCGANITDTVVINIGGPSLTLTSGTSSQSTCLNTAINPFSYTFGGSATGVNVTGLPTGVTFTISGNVVTISGTPTTTTGSPFTYSITTTGGTCGSLTANGTISVNTAGSMNLFCDGPNSTPTSLAFDFSNVGQSSFTYSYTIDGGAPITGTHISPSNFTVSGLTAGQTVVFTITANGVACVPPETVTCSTSCPSPTLTLTSAAGTTTQSTCINSAITPITYTFGNGATGVTVTGLPTGVTATTSGNNVTISGTPSTATGSPFSYTISTTGGTCGNVTLNGTITVNSNPTLVLNSAVATTSQSVCINTPINTISYTFGGSATGVTVTGLPTGVTATTSGNTVTITGTPSTTTGSPFSFSIVTTGGSCGTLSLNGTITVNPNTTLVLNSASSTTNQTVCINSAITPISYTFGNGATGVTVTGLPTGVTATTSGNNVTISGTPSTTTGSPFSYTITTTGGTCGNVTLNGTITVNSNPTLVLNSAVATTSQSVCINTPINTISYTFGGSATGVTVTGLPTGVTATTSGNTVTITGTPSTTTGSPFSYSIVTTGGSCGTLSLNGTITVNTNVSLILNSAANTTNQTICGATNITPISYTFGNGATGATVTGLPAGVTASTSGTTVTISGNPTGVIGTPYNYTITTIGGCGSQSLTGTITLTNGTIPTFTQVLPMCAGATSSPLPTTSTNGITGIWSPAFDNTNTTTYTFLPNSGQCALNTQMTIQIYPAPTVTATNLNPIFCTGGTTNIQLSSTVPGAIFSWTVTGVNVLGAAGGTGNSINQLLTVSPGTTSTVEVIYTIVAEANGCVGTPTQIRVQVNPIPDVMVSNTPGPICSGETTTISFTGSVPGTVFSWVITNITNLAGASNGTGTSIQQTLTTTGLSQGSVTYQITPTFNGCVGTPQSVTVLVNPRPELFTNPSHPPICSGENTSISVSTFNNNTTFTWTVNAVGVNGALSGTFTGLSTLIIQSLTTSGNTQGYVDYTIVPSSSGCTGTPITVRIYVNPLPEPILTDGAICVDEFGVPFQSYTLDSGLDNATYDFVWYFNGVAIPNSNNATYTANAVGTYGVIATNSITNCVSSDVTTMVTANVTSVTPAASMTVIQSAYFSGNATLTVNVTGGSGTLMYSLDEGTLQSSNVFTNVSSGPHTITVVDTQGCTYLTYTLLVIDYPHYFTPNGDGINDTWYIAGLQNTDVINIFDRYGKLIKQLKGEESWDGTYNQENLPSTDYWFTVDYLENGAKKQFKAHFAMKR
jgi:gliding motility-associated-like protein